MAKVLDLIGAINQNTQQYNDFISNLLSTYSDLPLDTHEIELLVNSIISTVNGQLNQTITRCDGLNILLNILPRCSKELLLKYSSLWISKSIQILEGSQSKIREIILACRVLACLTTLCKEIPELQIQISMQTLRQVVTIILNMDQGKRCGAIFFLLGTLMYHYKESSEKMQLSLRKLILPTIDATQNNLVQSGANCFVLLARVTERSFKPPSIKPTYTNWVYNQSLICNSLHVIMDDLFVDIMEMETVDIWNKLELPKISETNLFDYYSKIERRFENLTVFLSTMLRGCAGRNSVCPSEILRVLCRGLAINPTILKTDTFKHQILKYILPKLHINLVTILNGLIHGFRQELMPYGKTILKLYTQTLRWCETIQCNSVTIDGSKSFKNVKIAIYNSLSLWLTNLSSLSAIEFAVNEIIPYILKEITPIKNQVMLTVEKMQNQSKKAIKRFKNSQYENSSLLTNKTAFAEKDISSNGNLYTEALGTLKNIIYNTGSFVKLPLYKNIQKLIISMLYDVYLATDNTSFYKFNHNCRYNLLKVLRAIQMNPHPLLPPPTQYAIEIFTLAMNDEKIEIVKEAKISLIEIEKIVHPCRPTLQFPLLNREQDNIEKQFQSDSIIDVVLGNNTQQCFNIDDKMEEECSVLIDSVKNFSPSSGENNENRKKNSEKHKHEESIENIDIANSSESRPNKQRKLESSTDTSIFLDDINWNEDSIIEKTIESDPLIENNSDNSNSSRLSMRGINKNIADENVNNEKSEVGFEDDSYDEAIMGLFCDKLKED